jgi:hypothetical protein
MITSDAPKSNRGSGVLPASAISGVHWLTGQRFDPVPHCGPYENFSKKGETSRLSRRTVMHEYERSVSETGFVHPIASSVSP